MDTDASSSGGWRFAQCFGDKGEVEDITEGESLAHIPLLERITVGGRSRFGVSYADLPVLEQRTSSPPWSSTQRETISQLETRAGESFSLNATKWSV